MFISFTSQYTCKPGTLQLRLTLGDFIPRPSGWDFAYHFNVLSDLIAQSRSPPTHAEAIRSPAINTTHTPHNPKQKVTPNGTSGHRVGNRYVDDTNSNSTYKVGPWSLTVKQLLQPSTIPIINIHKDYSPWRQDDPCRTKPNRGIQTKRRRMGYTRITRTCLLLYSIV
jgi:hypothetical protein